MNNMTRMKDTMVAKRRVVLSNGLRLNFVLERQHRVVFSNGLRLNFERGRQQSEKISAGKIAVWLNQMELLQTTLNMVCS